MAPIPSGKGFTPSARSISLQGDLSYLWENKGDGRTTLLTEQSPRACVWPQRAVQEPEIATVTVAPSPRLCAWRGTQPLGLLLVLPTLSFISPLQFPVSFLEVCLPPNTHELRVRWCLVSSHLWCEGEASCQRVKPKPNQTKTKQTNKQNGHFEIGLEQKLLDFGN